jgi:predicted amidohydrolase YtcJ
MSAVVLRGGTVHTCDEQNTLAKVVAFENGRVLAVWR